MRALTQFLTDLPIARKLFLASLIPALTLLILSIMTYRSVATFSEDEGQLNSLYYSQRLASEYLRRICERGNRKPLGIDKRDAPGRQWTAIL